MDLALHGSDEAVGDTEFKASLHLLNVVLDKATARFPGQSLRLHFETRPSDPPFMYIFAKPVTPEDIEEVQGSSKAAIEEFERNILGLDAEDPDEDMQDFEPSVIREEGADAQISAVSDSEEDFASDLIQKTERVAETSGSTGAVESPGEQQDPGSAGIRGGPTNRTQA